MSFFKCTKPMKYFKKTWKIHINDNAINFHMLIDNIQIVFNDFFYPSAIFLLSVSENLVVYYS